MRSLASALSIKRSKPEESSTITPLSPLNTAPRLPKARSTSLFAKAPKTPVETDSNPYSRPSATPASSSSSEGSASLRTPEDDGAMAFPRHDEKRRWTDWFGWRKPSEKVLVDEPNEIQSRSRSDRNMAQNVSNRPNGLHPSQLARHNISDSEDDDNDDDESESEISESRPELSTRPRLTITQETMSKAQSNLRTLIRNGLAPLPSPPPLVDTHSVSQFPRSLNYHRTLPSAHSFETTLHMRRMLRRLERRSLTRAEVYSIATLGSRPKPTVKSQNNPDKKSDDEMMSYASMRVVQYSRGLRAWTSRPCFEQRAIVWMPNEEGDAVSKPILGVGRGLAVAEIEFSERVEALAGLHLDDETFEKALHPPSPPPSKASFRKSIISQRPPERITNRKSSSPSVPSPLRLEHGQPALSVTSPVSPASSAESSISSPKLQKSSRHREERTLSFASDIGDDVPLGYAMQAKKKLEEKQRFLQMEQEKRAKESKARDTEEQQRKEEDFKQVEEEQKRVEEERKLREEKQKARYAEEITAARQRREMSRTGVENFTNIREAKQREQEPSYSRPAYDTSTPSFATPSRKQAADYVKNTETRGASPQPPRPNSVVGSSENVRRGLAPQSTNFHSMEDLRPTPSRRQSTMSEVSEQHNQRPMSVISSSSRRLSLPRTQSAPMQVPTVVYPVVFTNVPPVPPMPMMPVIPPIPPMQMAPVWNMPMLSPNAPFAMQYPPPMPPFASNSQSRDSSPSRRSSASHTPPPPSPQSRPTSLHSGRPSHPRSVSDHHRPRRSSALSHSSVEPRRSSRSTSLVAQQQTSTQYRSRNEHSNLALPSDGKRRVMM